MRILHQSIREATIIIAAAIVLGFAYTYITKKGFFSEKNQSSPAATSSLEMIPIEKAKELYESQDALFIDSRHEFEYKNGHIHGAINIALAEIDTHRQQLESIPKAKMLIVYCDGAECNSSVELALKLMELKFSNVRIFFGGWQEWKSHHLPIDTE